MATKLYVGNLPFSATEDAVRELFAPFGQIYSVQLPTDRETGRPRGFGFVEMDNAAQAIQALDGKDFGGRNLRVNEASAERPQRSFGGGGGGFSRPFGAGGGGGGRPGGPGGGRPKGSRRNVRARKRSIW